jgi:hypothetical protein
VTCRIARPILTGIIVGKRGLVVLGFVAKHQPKRRSKTGFVDQGISVKVPYLVSKVTKQGAIGFAKGNAPDLALHIVGLRKVERYQAGFVTGHDRPMLVRQNLECQTKSTREHDGQAKSSQVVDQPALGFLHARPKSYVTGILRGGNDMGKRAGHAVGSRRNRAPVATDDIPVDAFKGTFRTDHYHVLRIEDQRMHAAIAFGELEGR